MALPEKIKAAVVPQFGDIDVIQLGELPFPTQKPNEVLIKVCSFHVGISSYSSDVLDSRRLTTPV